MTCHQLRLPIVQDSDCDKLQYIIWWTLIVLATLNSLRSNYTDSGVPSGGGGGGGPGPEDPPHQAYNQKKLD